MEFSHVLNEDFHDKLRGMSPQTNYTERSPLVGEVSANFRL
jgi:hypothetical protein